MTPLRLGIAGAGLIGRAHGQRIAAHPGCELVAFADPSPGAAALAKEAGVPLHRDLATLLAGTSLDGVILATPNALHVSGALECIAQKVPALIEKPVADTLADAQRLLAAVESAGVPMLVGHHRRYSAILAAAQAAIASGRLGRIVAVTGSATFYKPDSYFNDGPWRRVKGGGPILINMVHEVDNLRALMPPVAGEIVEVQAMASNAARGFEVEDTAVINLRFEGGALGSFVLSDAAASPRSWEQTTGENKSYDRHEDEDCYVVAGTRGSLSVPTMRQRTYAGDASWWQPLNTERLPLVDVDPLVAQLDHFCAVIRGDVAPQVDVRSATRTLAVTLAIAEAAATGRPQTLSLT